LNNPHRLNFDVALLKRFKVSESSELEFRAEAFNVLITLSSEFTIPITRAAVEITSSVAMPAPTISAGFKASGV